MNHLLEEIKSTRVINNTAAGQGDVEGSVIDMEGFDDVLFEVALGTLTATTVVTLKVQQATDLAFTTPQDLEDTAVDVDDQQSDKLVYSGVVEPTERYVRCVVTRATADAEVNAGVAYQHKARDLPTTQDATTVVAGAKFRVSPAEGTP